MYVQQEQLNCYILEKVIQSCTGHLLLKALRMYENPTEEEHSAACNVLVRSNMSPLEVLRPTQSTAGPETRWHKTTIFLALLYNGKNWGLLGWF